MVRCCWVCLCAVGGVQLDKDLAKGLKDLLDFEGDVEEVYSQSFQVTVRDVYGEVQVVDLIPGGDQVPLTADNREEYVARAIKVSIC